MIFQRPQDSFHPADRDASGLDRCADGISGHAAPRATHSEELFEGRVSELRGKLGGLE